MYLMFVVQPSSWVIGNANAPNSGMPAFPLDEFKHVHNDDFRGFNHGTSQVNLYCLHPLEPITARL
jgi:hypothetical protein